MKKRMLTVLCVLISALVFSQGDNPLLKYLPSEASMIMSFNPVAIAKKVPGETFRQSFLYRELMKNESNGLKNFLEDPSVIGVDFSHDLLLIINEANTGGEDPGFFISGRLKDPAVFASNMKNMRPDKEPLSVSAGGGQVNIIAADGIAMAWNNEAFVLTNGMTNKLKKEMMKDMPLDSGMPEAEMEKKMKEWEAKMAEVQEKINKMLVDYCTDLYSQKGENPFLKNAALAELMEKSADIRMWTNGSGLGNALEKMPPVFKSFFGKLQNKMAAEKISIINFEDGKISGLTKSYMNPELDALYKKNPTGKLNTELIQKLPDENIMGLFAFSANPEMSRAMMKHLGFDEMLDSIKSKIPFDPSLIASSLGSDILLAVMKGSSKENAKGGSVSPADAVAAVSAPEISSTKVDFIEEAKPRGSLGVIGMDLILAMPINNPDNFKKLKEAASKFIDSVRKTEDGEKIFGENPPVIKFNDKYCVFAITEKMADAFLKKEPSGKLPDWVAANSSHPMLVSLSFKDLMSFVFSTLVSNRSNQGDEGFMKAVGVFDRMNITGGNYSNGAMHSSMEFRFSNPGENAMKQLFEFINIAVEETAKNKEMRTEVIQDEEVAVPPPPPPPPPVKKPKTKTKN